MSSRPLHPVVGLCVAAMAIVVVAFLWLVILSYSSIYNSDAFAIPQRMMQFEAGEIGLVQLLLQKHVEHFHSLIFLLGFVDWRFLEGTMMLPRVAGTLSALLYAMLVAWVAWGQERLAANARWVLATCVLAVALSGTGWVVWTISFQSVVSTFWILYVCAIYAACRAAVARRKALRWFAVGLFSSSVALFAHGSGFLAILVPAVPLLLERRWKLASVHVAALGLLYGCGTAISSQFASGSMLPAGAMVRAIVFDFPGFVQANLLYLGSSVIYDPEAAVWAGLVCAMAATSVLAITVHMLARGRSLSVADVFSLCLLLSAGISACLATILRFSLGVQAGGPINPYAFMESRYFLASSGAWIGLAIFLAPRLPYRAGVPAALVLGAVFFVSGLRTGVPAAQIHTAFMRQAEISAVSRHYDAVLMRWLFPDPVQAVRWLEFAATRGKGPFSATRTVGNSLVEGPITSRSQTDVILPNGDTGTACRLSGPLGVEGQTVRLVDAEGHVAAFGEPSRYETNLTQATFDVEDYLKRYPDVAAAVDLGHVEAWQHFEAARRAGEPRLARSLEPGWLAYASTCAVSALR